MISEIHTILATIACQHARLNRAHLVLGLNAPRSRIASRAISRTKLVRFRSEKDGRGMNAAARSFTETLH